MRILNEDSDSPIWEVTLMLTPDEAKELTDKLINLQESDNSSHQHVSDSDFQRRITVAVYTPERVKTFSQRIQRLLLEE